MAFSIKITIILSIILTTLLILGVIGFQIYKKRKERAKTKADFELRNKYRAPPKEVVNTNKQMGEYGKRIGAQDVQGGLVMEKNNAATSTGAARLTKPTGPMSGITTTVGPTTHTIIAVPEEGDEEGDEEEAEEDEGGDEEEEEEE